MFGTATRPAPSERRYPATHRSQALVRVLSKTLLVGLRAACAAENLGGVPIFVEQNAQLSVPGISGLQRDVDLLVGQQGASGQIRGANQRRAHRRCRASDGKTHLSEADLDTRYRGILARALGCVGSPGGPPVDATAALGASSVEGIGVVKNATAQLTWQQACRSGAEGVLEEVLATLLLV